MYSLRGDTVFDPFLGTGTTTAAAVATARHSIGAEFESNLREEIFRVVAELSKIMNTRIGRRPSDHRSFVENRRAEGKAPLKHQNDRFGFPVMTTQETELTLSYVDSIQREGSDAVSATHRDFGAEDAVDGPAPAPPMLWGFPDTE